MGSLRTGRAGVALGAPAGFLALKPEPQLRHARANGVPSLREGVRFHNVSFTYPGADRPALANVTLTLRPQERVALVGENGAGKTTLVRLLLGLYRPDAGRITVDGTDLTDLEPGTVASPRDRDLPRLHALSDERGREHRLRRRGAAR